MNKRQRKKKQTIAIKEVGLLKLAPDEILVFRFPSDYPRDVVEIWAKNIKEHVKQEVLFVADDISIDKIKR